MSNVIEIEFCAPDASDRSWSVVGPLTRGHASIYRATGGRLGQHVPGIPPMLLLDHVGAKSGTLRTTPLVYMPDGNRFVVVAAKGGHPTNPSWYHNLRTPEHHGPSRRSSRRGARPGDRFRGTPHSLV